MYKKFYSDSLASLREQQKQENKQKFTEIYERTLLAFHLTPDLAPCSNACPQCWRDIMHVWNSLGTSCEYNVIYDAVYHIAWNRYCISNPSADYLELLALVEHELVSEGYAYEAWLANGSVDGAMEKIRSTVSIRSGQCHSERFGRYIYANAYRKIYIKDRATSDSFAEMRSMYDAIMLGSTRGAVEIVNMFENIIFRLLPCASSWTQNIWTDEAAIMAEIQRVQGVDYSPIPGEFDQVIDAFSAALQGKSCDRFLVRIANFTASMAACIWTENTDKKIERFLIRLCKKTRKQMKSTSHYRGLSPKKVLMRSWVYQGFKNGTLAQTIEAKKAVFEVELNL